MKNASVFSILLLLIFTLSAAGQQSQSQDSTQTYKKRILENPEIDFLTSYYSQTGNNAAVTGGIGTEKLMDVTGNIVVSIPLNDDDVLTIDAGISAYTSASSSNINPFDGGTPANAFVASSGASSGDVWTNLTGTFTHNSDDRNTIWSATVSGSNEFDYKSFGVGGSLAKLFNEKNTEVSVNANAYFDNWELIFPIELRGSVSLPRTDRKSYSLGFGFSQIMSKRMQGSLALDLVAQQGLLSTPFQRVYFSDVNDQFSGNFHLGEDIERLPESRLKIALGGRLNYYLNELIVLRSFYRYYQDDWGIVSHTASLEMPIKIGFKFTVYPSYRYYFQSAADYFAGYNMHLSTASFYTSDYDLSRYSANQFGLGVTYTDLLTSFKIGSLGLKSADLKFDKYDRSTSLSAWIITGGVKFVME